MSEVWTLVTLLRSVQLQRQLSLTLLRDRKWPQGCAAVGMGTWSCTLPHRTKHKGQKKNLCDPPGKTQCCWEQCSSSSPGTSKDTHRHELSCFMHFSEVTAKHILSSKQITVSLKWFTFLWNDTHQNHGLFLSTGIMLFCDDGIVGGIRYTHMLTPVQLQLLKNTVTQLSQLELV